jgi:hypothetical protein
VVTLLFGNFLLKVENMLDRHRFAVLANLAGLYQSLSVELINQANQSLGFVLFLWIKKIA